MKRKVHILSILSIYCNHHAPANSATTAASYSLHCIGLAGYNGMKCDAQSSIRSRLRNEQLQPQKAGILHVQPVPTKCTANCRATKRASTKQLSNGHSSAMEAP